jgi:hypothetical protein
VSQAEPSEQGGHSALATAAQTSLAAQSASTAHSVA